MMMMKEKKRTNYFTDFYQRQSTKTLLSLSLAIFKTHFHNLVMDLPISSSLVAKLHQNNKQNRIKVN